MSKFKKGICIAAAIILGIVVLGFMSTIFANDSKNAGAIFKVGGLDEITGKYVENDKTIYTEKAIDCYGLRIEPDFESTVTYDIFYYDGEDKLLKVVKGLSDVYDEDFEVAEKCRIVIHPEIPEDVKEKDFKVRFWNVAKYSSMLKITNSKKSNVIDYSNNLYNEEKLIKGYGLIIDHSSNEPLNINNLIHDENTSGYFVSPIIDVDKSADGIVMFVKATYPPESYGYLFLANEDGICVDEGSFGSVSTGLGDGWHKIILSESSVEDAVYARLCFDNMSNIENAYVYYTYEK